MAPFFPRPRLPFPGRRRFFALPPCHSLCSMAIGFLISFLLCSILFGGEEDEEAMGGGWKIKERREEEEGNIQSAEHWQRRVVGTGPKGPGVIGEPQPQPKVNRARFAASELGIRDRVLVMPLIRSPLGLSLYRWVLSPHFPSPSLRPIVDISRVDPTKLADSIVLWPNNPTPTHVQLLNVIANLTLQHSFDWFLLLPDRTFLNPFLLRRILAKLQWHLPLAMGHQRANDGALCATEAGILLSNPAMRQLVEGRHLCQGIVARSYESALAKCIRLATNLSCQSRAQGVHYHWWQVPSADDRNGPSSLGTSLHDQIIRLASLPGPFNRSLTVSPLLSDSDIHALLEHFLHVEIGRMDEEIDGVEKELAEEFGEKEAGWPIGTTEEGAAPNRFQVPVWEMFTEDGKMFGDDPNRNVEEMAGEEKGEELGEVIRRAREEVADDQGRVCAVRQGYRRFSPERGMEYLVDLECPHRGNVRVQLLRPLHATTVLDKVPFVKEDSDLTLVVPVDSPDHVFSLRALFRRQIRLCTSSSPRSSAPSNNRQTRFVVTARSLEAAVVRLLGSDLVELKKKCKAWLSDSALLLLQPDPAGQVPVEIAAMDATVDHYGHQTLFLLLSPFADFQPDFLDRVRINTIRHFQVFFPVPFAEFNPVVTGLSPSPNSSSSAEIGDFIIHKDRGRFDTEEFGVAAFYGSDFASARSNFPPPHPSSASNLAHLFLSSSSSLHHLHLMRPIDPSLRIRFHPRICPAGKELERCERNRREGMGTRAQLARMVFGSGEGRRTMEAEGGIRKKTDQRR